MKNAASFYFSSGYSANERLVDTVLLMQAAQAVAGSKARGRHEPLKTISARSVWATLRRLRPRAGAEMMPATRDTAAKVGSPTWCRRDTRQEMYALTGHATSRYQLKEISRPLITATPTLADCRAGACGARAAASFLPRDAIA